jgi:peroxiredoxin
MSVRIGEKAPQFTLYASDKSEVSLSDYKGQKVLLLFFPLAFSSTCTKEMCAMRDDISAYEAAGVQILAISVDSVYTLAQYKRKYKLPFPLLSDFNKEVSRAYGALHESFSLSMRGVSMRAGFVIDNKGTLRYSEILEKPGELPDFAALKEVLSRLK